MPRWQEHPRFLAPSLWAFLHPLVVGLMWVVRPLTFVPEVWISSKSAFGFLCWKSRELWPGPRWIECGVGWGTGPTVWLPLWLLVANSWSQAVGELGALISRQQWSFNSSTCNKSPLFYEYAVRTPSWVQVGRRACVRLCACMWICTCTGMNSLMARKHRKWKRRFSLEFKGKCSQ